jgi:hypothetical protein
MLDIPITVSKQFQYADDIALTFQANSFAECEKTLEADLDKYIRIKVRPNPSKTESCVFHLNTHEANRQLDVRFAGTEIQHSEHPKYFGVTLDRTKTSKKVSACINIVRKLAGTGWGAGGETLRTAALAIVYSTAEYCAPVWLNNAMRIVSGCVKSTQLPWLPTLAHIAPHKLRRKAAAVRELVNCRRHANSLLYEQLLDIPIPSLVSRRPIWTMEEYSMTALFNIAGAWTDYWSAAFPVNGYLILDPNSRPPGFDLGRHEWVLLNRFRTPLRADVHL